MSNIRIIIVEDEIQLQELLQRIVEKYIPDAKVIGIARSVSSAKKLIKDLEPDLVLMDIEIDEGTGFDVLYTTTERPYDVIFVTAYDHYAIEALRASAIDYILKPVIIEELKEAFTRYRARQDQGNGEKKERYVQVQGVLLQSKIFYENIEYIEIKKGQCIFHIVGDRYIHSLKPVSQYAEKFPLHIHRIHRLYYVNIDQITDLELGRGGNVILKSGKKIPVAYRKKDELKNIWEGGSQH